MIVYKINVIEALREAGYNTNRIRKESTISENTLQKLRNNEMIGMESLNRICHALDMQPGNIIKYVEHEDDMTPRKRAKSTSK